MAKDVKIRITADDRTKGVISGVKKNLVQLGRVTATLGRGISSFTRGVVRGLRNVAFAATATVAAMAGLVKAYTVQEDAEAALAAALGHTGRKLNDTMKDYKAFAASIQDVTRFGDEAILAQIAYAKNLGVAEDQLKDTTTAAVGLAAKLGIDLKTSMMLMGRAALGQTQMLTRYGIVLDESLTPQEKFNTLLQIGAKNFKLAEAAAQTTAGRFAQFKNRVGDVFEAFGGGIVDALNLADVLDRLSTRLDGLLDKWRSDGTIDEWAARAEVAVNKVADILEGLFAGGAERAVAVGEIKAIGASFGQSIVDVLIANAPKIGKAIANGIFDIGGPIASSVASGVSQRINPLNEYATQIGSDISASAQGTNKRLGGRVVGALATGGMSEMIMQLASIAKFIQKETKVVESLKQPESP